jgi:hypothetical protein
LLRNGLLVLQDSDVPDSDDRGMPLRLNVRLAKKLFDRQRAMR